MPRHGRSALTLTEILVVAGIVALVTALAIPGVAMLRDTARATDTAQRLDMVVQGLAGQGGSGRQAVDLLHGQVIAPHLKSLGYPTGVLRFAVSHETNIRYAIWNNARPATTALDGNYISTAAAHCLPFPWGQPILDDVTGQPGPSAHPFAMPAMSPTATLALLNLAGITVDAATWSSDRGSRRPFNDAWGNPLIVSYAFYQPRRNTTVRVRTMQAGGGAYTAIDDIRDVLYEDLFFTHAEKAYQYTKAVYLVAAAAGPVLAQPLRGSALPADIAADQQALWDQAAAACDAARWDADAWAKPPWNGVRQGRGTIGGVRVRSLLSAPVMVK